MFFSFENSFGKILLLLLALNQKKLMCFDVKNSHVKKINIISNAFAFFKTEMLLLSQAFGRQSPAVRLSFILARSHAFELRRTNPSRGDLSWASTVGG